MYFQLFYTLPVFIDQWVDTRNLYQWLENISPLLAGIFGTTQRTVNPEMILNLDALYIVLFQVIISSIVMRLRPINAMIAGIIIASAGIGLTFMFNNAFFLFLSILIFAFGEMTSSPKITEYIGRIAPPDKVGLYMGCSFLPMSGGNFFAGVLSGPVYGTWADKVFLLQQDMAVRGIDMPALSESFTQNELFFEAARAYQMTVPELTEYLWNTYHPSDIWWLFTGIGLATAFLLFVFDRLLMRSNKGMF
jgi:dipeptide/tripeptide permease